MTSAYDVLTIDLNTARIIPTDFVTLGKVNEMATRCPKCGNEIPDWNAGRCAVCRMNSRDARRRYGWGGQRNSDVALRRMHRRPPGQPRPSGSLYVPTTHGYTADNPSWELTTGIWKSEDRSITLDFAEHVYQDRDAGTLRKFDLTVLSDEGPDISLKINKWQVKAWVDNFGNLVLHRKTMVGFLCLFKGKMHKLCNGCRRLSWVRIRSCKVCGRSW